MTAAVASEPWLSARALAALVAGSLLFSQTVNGLYEALGRSEPEGVSALGNLLISLSVIAWFRSYSRVRAISWVFDMDTFLLWLWIVVVPYYVVRREGWRGVWRVLLFALAYVVAGFVGSLVPRIALALAVDG